MGLTYEVSSISATLDDVWSDVGKPSREQFSTHFYETPILSTRGNGRKLKVSNIPRMRLMRALS